MSPQALLNHCMHMFSDPKLLNERKQEILATEGGASHDMPQLQYVSKIHQLSRKKAEKTHGPTATEVALTAEIQQLLDTKTLLDPTGIKFDEIVNGNAHYEEKQLLCETGNGNIPIYMDYLRARLTADGSKQHFEMHEQRSSPTVHYDNLILALHICAYNKWYLSSCDIKGAYLQVDISQRTKKIGLKLRKDVANVLHKLKPEWKSRQAQDGSITVLLGTALYGLGDSGALWNNQLHLDMIEFGFDPSPMDKCLYKYDKVDGIMLVPLFVDDLLPMSSSLELRDRFYAFLESKYGPMKKQNGPVIKHLGVKITYDQVTGRMDLDQRDYYDTLFQKFNVNGTATTPSTPSTPNLFKRSSDPADNTPVDKNYYLSMLMSIAFVAQRTRPDYQKENGWLAKYSTAPTKQDQEHLNRLFRNLRFTYDEVRTIAPHSLTLEVYIDSSHAIHSDYKGHTGGVTKLGGSTVSVFSKPQKLNSHSSCETELIGLDFGLTRLQPLIYQLEWLNVKCKPVKVYQDNKSVIRMTEQSFQLTSRTKHIGIRFFYIQQLVFDNVITIEYKNTKDMIADILTKPLQGQLYLKLRRAILGIA